MGGGGMKDDSDWNLVASHMTATLNRYSGDSFSIGML